jgi:23S rRNA pseudouridine1911/1915/1917 synthase
VNTEPNIRVRHFEVDHNFVDWRLDQFLCNRIPRLSRNRAAEICKHGDIEIDPPRKVKAGTKLRFGDVVTLREHLPPETVQYDEVEVVWEDDDVLVVNKPAGMLVHESASVRLNTVQHWLLHAGYDEAEAVHRLDRETSGCLVCAKRGELVPPLRELFATDHPDKVYRALVLDAAGRWRVGARDTLTTPLGLLDDSRVRLRMGRGKLSATTHVEVLGEGDLGEFGRCADLRVTIETGRQHQIRVHLSLEGTPVAGDKLYTYDDDFFIDITDNPEEPELLAQLPFERHALHAWQIALPHPRRNARIEAQAPLPDIWRDPRG